MRLAAHYLQSLSRACRHLEQVSPAPSPAASVSRTLFFVRLQCLTLAWWKVASLHADVLYPPWTLCKLVNCQTPAASDSIIYWPDTDMTSERAGLFHAEAGYERRLGTTLPWTVSASAESMLLTMQVKVKSVRPQMILEAAVRLIQWKAFGAEVRPPLIRNNQQLESHTLRKVSPMYVCRWLQSTH